MFIILHDVVNGSMFNIKLIYHLPIKIVLIKCELNTNVK